MAHTGPNKAGTQDMVNQSNKIIENNIRAML